MQKVYNIFIKSLGKDTRHVCQSLQHKFHISQTYVLTLSDLVKIHGKRAIIEYLIYNRKYINIDLIRDCISQLSTSQHNKDYKQISQNRKKWLNSDVFKVITSYLTIGDLLRFAIINRLWHHNIMNKSFVSNARIFRSFTLTLQALRNWSMFSSRWYLNNLHVLHIDVDNDQLKDTHLPKFEQKTIQYLDTNSFYCTKPLYKLNALKIWGNNKYMSSQCINKWQLQKQHTTAIQFIVLTNLYINSYSFIPCNKCILFDKTHLDMSVLKYFISNNHTKWIGIQQGHIFDNPNEWQPECTGANIMQHTPNTKLNLLYTGTWAQIQWLLKCNSLYDKYISHLNIVMHYKLIDKNMTATLTSVTKITNCNQPKSIAILLHHQGPIMTPAIAISTGCVERDEIVWNWIKYFAPRIQRNANITEFVIGLMRTDGQLKQSVCFDLKKISFRQQLKQEINWNDILYFHETDMNSNCWIKQFNKICNSIK